MGAQHNTPMHAAQHAPSGSVSATAVHVTDETHIDTRIPTRCIPEAYIHTRARVHTQWRHPLTLRCWLLPPHGKPI